jgi:hypothetical protein
VIFSPDLRYLSLHVITLSKSGPLSLPSLTQLALEEAHLDDRLFFALLTPLTSPNLTVLYFHRMYFTGVEVPFPVLPSELASRFALVGTTLASDDPTPEQPALPVHRLLIDVDSIVRTKEDFALEGGTLNCHFRLYFSDAHSFDPNSPFYSIARTMSVDEDFRFLISHLYARPRSGLRLFFPKSLHLPRTLHPSSTVDPALAQLRNELLELCARESFAVWWYDDLSDAGWFVQEDFVTEARQVKAEKEAEG